MAALFFVILAAILIVQGVRKIPIQFAKKWWADLPDRIAKSRVWEITSFESECFRGNAYHLCPGHHVPAFDHCKWLWPTLETRATFWFPSTTGSQYRTTWYFFTLVVLFTYVYTALIVNPKQYATYLKKIKNSFIPGVKPGDDTEEYIDSTYYQNYILGPIFLGLIAIFACYCRGCWVSDAFAIFFRYFIVDPGRVAGYPGTDWVLFVDA